MKPALFIEVAMTAACLALWIVLSRGKTQNAQLASSYGLWGGAFGVVAIVVTVLYKFGNSL